MKFNIIVTDIVNDVTYSCNSVNTHVVITLLLHDVIHWKTATKARLTNFILNDHSCKIHYVDINIQIYEL